MWFLANSSGWPWRQKKIEEQNWRSYQTAPVGHGEDEETKARLEKMVATTQLKLALETEEERRGGKGMDLI